jgi:hypothetical protein
MELLASLPLKSASKNIISYPSPKILAKNKIFFVVLKPLIMGIPGPILEYRQYCCQLITTATD